MKDCIIVGGGPAGLTAALYLARFLRDVVVFDAGEGRAGMIPKTHNLAPFPAGITGQDLLGQMRSHAERYGAQLAVGTVHEIARNDGAFQIATDGHNVDARRILLATGVVNHRPPLPTKDHDLGLSRGLIRYCPICDAYEVRDKRIAVLGSGEHGVAEARFIRRYSRDVTLIPADGTIAQPTDGIAGLASPMRRLSLTDRQVIVELVAGAPQRFDTLYVALGTTPRSNLAEALGAARSGSGCVVVDDDQQTSIDGVFAIGDIVEGLDQIAFAMGQGAVAATAIHNSLRKSDDQLSLP